MKNGLIERPDESKFWYLNDQLHRTDGPAIERSDGSKQYWVHGKRITKKHFHSKIFQIQLIMNE